LTPANAGAVVQICQRLDGMPLALELAATRVRFLTVEEIAHHLDDAFRLLTGGNRAALPRHQTLRATLDWSYQLLSDEERLVWHRLSVFPGSFTLDAAEAVAVGTGIERDAMLDLLGQLVGKSIVMIAEQNRNTRYYLLETIRQFGHEKLVSTGDARLVRRRHLSWEVERSVRAASVTPEVPQDRGRALSEEPPLTDRERDVTRLIAEGCTDREIGGRLCISPHTVRRHLENIFAKLEISSRSKLVAWAFQQSSRFVCL
jgi:predicted ATPase